MHASLLIWIYIYTHSAQPIQILTLIPSIKKKGTYLPEHLTSATGHIIKRKISTELGSGTIY